MSFLCCLLEYVSRGIILKIIKLWNLIPSLLRNYSTHSYNGHSLIFLADSAIVFASSVNECDLQISFHIPFQSTRTKKKEKKKKEKKIRIVWSNLSQIFEMSPANLCIYDHTLCMTTNTQESCLRFRFPCNSLRWWNR